MSAAAILSRYAPCHAGPLLVPSARTGREHPSVCCGIGNGVRAASRGEERSTWAGPFLLTPAQQPPRLKRLYCFIFSSCKRWGCESNDILTTAKEAQSVLWRQRKAVNGKLEGGTLSLHLQWKIVGVQQKSHGHLSTCPAPSQERKTPLATPYTTEQ